ncbi:di-heme oxidoredictase family protein [Planctomycetes bacterium K23_9]|uniref:Cytochrome c n=1 Tax=Stieleria marina TaxID=1930275 RepID=A0A517NSW0_9BACT|nr:Cytochrome c [Planctomycetes bacterium K23_9]
MNLFRVSPLMCLIASCFLTGTGHSASPEMINQGRALFEREWPATNPSLGSDGLGPLFNGKSCIACHNQGGVGGAGEAKFNAMTFGIEEMHITGGGIIPDIITSAVREFSPGFVNVNGGVADTFAVQHHGGTAKFRQARKLLTENSLAKFSEAGGPVSASEVQYANATPILYNAQHGEYNVSIRARLFQRNTTPLFGVGLIDRVNGKTLDALARMQERNPEISGRVATLSDGRFGRFGWRGNIATLLEFNDNACAAEVGLQTSRIPQPADPTLAEYRNPAPDISDAQIQAMTVFVASLPAPERKLPNDQAVRDLVVRGEKVFAAVGCAACHVPNVGPAKGLYSDLLLHDMGKDSFDLNPAEPYIYQVQPFENYSTSIPNRSRIMTGSESRSAAASGYYGRRRLIQMAAAAGRTSYTYTPRTGTRDSIGYIVQDSNWRFAERYIVEKNDGSLLQKVSFSSEDDDKTDKLRGKKTTVIATQNRGLRLFMKGTNVAQEWRTPPLWGVRDSAPYMHDGRAETLLEAIMMHEGEGAPTRDRFLNLSVRDRRAVVAFLNTMVAPQNAPEPAS